MHVFANNILHCIEYLKIIEFNVNQSLVAGSNGMHIWTCSKSFTEKLRVFFFVQIILIKSKYEPPFVFMYK